MKVLVTGGAGFIGSHIVELISQQGIDVVVFDDLSSGKLHNLHPSIRLYQGELNSSMLDELFENEKPSHIIHHAAQTNVFNSVNDPIKDAMSNIIGTVNLLRCAQKFGVTKVVYASSAAVYGNVDNLPLSESLREQPISPYGISKYTPELYLKTYSEYYGLSHTILRYSNVYGSRQNTSADGGVVSIFVDQLRKGNQLVVYGDGGQTRDFVYVKDIARANLLSLNKGDGQVINISSGTLISVNELIQTLGVATGCDVQPVYQPSRPGDILHSSLDNTKAKLVLGWSPDYNLSSGLKEMFNSKTMRNSGEYNEEFERQRVLG